LEKQGDDTANSRRGQARNYNDDQIQFVVNQYREYSKQRQKVKIMAFMNYLHAQWKAQSWLTKMPSRKTVEDMLTANGLRKVTPAPSRKANYYEPALLSSTVKIIKNRYHHLLIMVRQIRKPPSTLAVTVHFLSTAFLIVPKPKVTSKVNLDYLKEPYLELTLKAKQKLNWQ
jgi:hypothetical protein